MRVVVHQVDAHVARPDLAEDGVHVGAVEVEQGPSIVEQTLGDVADLRVEQADRVGVGHHEDGGLVVEVALKSSRSTRPLAVALDRDGLEPGEVGRGGIGPVGAVGDRGPWSASHPCRGSRPRRTEQRRQLSLGPGRRLEADGVQAGDLGEHRLCISNRIASIP